MLEDYRKLTWSAKATSEVSLRCKEIGILLVTKTFFDLGNDLNLLGRLLGKIIKS